MNYSNRDFIKYELDLKKNGVVRDVKIEDAVKFQEESELQTFMKIYETGNPFFDTKCDIHLK